MIKTIDIQSQKLLDKKTITTGNDIKSNFEIDKKKKILYVGVKGGNIECWDLNSCTKLYYINAHKSKVRYI